MHRGQRTRRGDGGIRSLPRPCHSRSPGRDHRGFCGDLPRLGHPGPGGIPAEAASRLPLSLWLGENVLKLEASRNKAWSQVPDELGSRTQFSIDEGAARVRAVSDPGTTASRRSRRKRGRTSVPELSRLSAQRPTRYRRSLIQLARPERLRTRGRRPPDVVGSSQATPGGAAETEKGPLARDPFFVSLARPERFELPTFWFVARHSIQLSYGRVVPGNSTGGERGIRTLDRAFDPIHP